MGVARPEGDGELTFSRVFAAPRDVIFDCMTQPEHLTYFWAPLGASTPLEHIRIDPREGGIFETLIVNDTDGSSYATRAVFVEVQKPERLVWTEHHTGMTVYVTLSSRPDGTTELHLRQTNVPAVVRLPENQAGFTTWLDKFVNYVGRLPTHVTATDPHEEDFA